MFVDFADAQAFLEAQSKSSALPPHRLRWPQVSIKNFFQFQRETEGDGGGLVWLDAEAIRRFERYLEEKRLWSTGLIRFQTRTLHSFLKWMEASRSHSDESESSSDK